MKAVWLLLLLVSAPAWGNTMAYDVQIGAATVLMEASAEPPEGQIAVAHVLVNRLKSKRWGATLAAVCLYPFQFSSWNTKDPNRKRIAVLDENDPLLQRIEGYVRDALAGKSEDPTGGALFYMNPAIADPSWGAKFVKVADIGRHAFYREP